MKLTAILVTLLASSVVFATTPVEKKADHAHKTMATKTTEVKKEVQPTVTTKTETVKTDAAATAKDATKATKDVSKEVKKETKEVIKKH